MNNPKDFKKMMGGTVLNTNTHDFRRARKRNFIRKQQDDLLGDGVKEGKLDKTIRDFKAEHKGNRKLKKEMADMKKELNDLKKLVAKLSKGDE